MLKLHFPGQQTQNDLLRALWREVEGATAQAEVVVDVTYTSEYPNDPHPIMTKEADLEYVISLIYQGNQWYITSDQHFDTFSKQGRRGPGVPYEYEKDSAVPHANSGAFTFCSSIRLAKF